MSSRSRYDFGTPSSISRDLRSPASSSALRGQGEKVTSVTSPILESSDGVLSKVYGSLVEPESKRQNWACNGCGTIFQRDATIFVAPANPSAAPLGPSDANNRERLLQGGNQDHYCRACYSDRFSMGACSACQKAVLGSTKEDGKYVKASSGDIWHGRCWKCINCGEADAKKISLGMTGKPTCETCFDRPSSRGKGENKDAPRSDPMQSPRGRRISPSNSAASMSGSASRSGMGATIAELSKKFGKPIPVQSKATEATSSASPDRASSERVSPERLSHSRSNSLSGSTRMRPLTAQFSGTGFNLAAFQPSSPVLTRSDSRSRSVSPHKRSPLLHPICARCNLGPFESLTSQSDVLESTMISIPKEALYYHPACFCCTICSLPMDEASRSFVRLGDRSYAHPQCAPPTIVRSDPAPLSAPMTRQSSSASINDHPTHQRETRPSMSSEVKPATMPTSYLSSSPRDDDHTSTQAPRRFKSSAGAAPPTRSTLIQQRPSSRSNLASLAVASESVSTGSNGRVHADKFSRLGGMNRCGGCNLTVSALESIPGPRGMRWHKKCLICSSKSKGKLCGKALDSSARVDEEGQIRCRQCFDAEHSRHPLK